MFYKFSYYYLLSKRQKTCLSKNIIFREKYQLTKFEFCMKYIGKFKFC